MAKIMTLQQFETAVGEKLTFFKGKGRAFCPTPIGTLYVADSYDPKKQGFVMETSKDSDLAEKRPELIGTLWICNANLTVFDIKDHKPVVKPTAKKNGK